jgi:hypothetical protein
MQQKFKPIPQPMAILGVVEEAIQGHGEVFCTQIGGNVGILGVNRKQPPAAPTFSGVAANVRGNKFTDSG